MSDELRPTFLVTVTLDGDDYPPTSAAIVRVSLESHLRAMVADGVIRSFEVEDHPPLLPAVERNTA